MDNFLIEDQYFGINYYETRCCDMHEPSLCGTYVADKF